MFAVLIGNVVWLDWQVAKLPQKITPAPTQTIIEKQVPQATPSEAKEPKTTPSSAVSSPSFKEYFLPLGTGTTRQTTWADIASAVVTFNKADYPGLGKINWQATLTVNPPLNGIVAARLYNVTDGYVIEGSTMATGQGGLREGVLQSSDNLNLPDGQKTYRVQMYSSVGYDATITGAYVHLAK